MKARRFALVEVVCAAILSLTWTGARAVAATGSPPPVPRTTAPSGRALADLDGNHVSDGLDRALARGAAWARHDVVATFVDRTALASARRTMPSLRGEETFSLIPGFAGRLTGSQILGLSHMPGVVRIEENFVVRAMDDASNADFGITGARTDFGVTGAGVEVCVVDSGVDLGHEQLDSKAPIGWLDLVGGETTPYDDMGHGTHVASIAVGDGVGSKPIAARMRGVAPDASLLAVKVIDSTGYGDDSLEVQGIQWCAARAGVDVISISLGSDVPSDGLDAVSQAVDAAVLTKGKIVVAAAGNSGDLPGTITSPGSAMQAITVGAVAEWSAGLNAPYRSEGPYLAPFSSRGPTVDDRIKPDIVAPGVTIDAAESGTTSGYVVESGTSMATPFVAGTAALLRQLQPSWTQADVRAAIEGTAFDAGPAGKDADWGAGLLDGYGAIALAAGGSGQTPFPAYQRITGTVADSGMWTTSFTLSDADLGVPIAATITVEGAPVCTLDLGPLGCLAWEWGPDLDAELLDPDGLVVASSTCAADDECGVGRQETLHTTPTTAGTYTIDVTPFGGTPNNGAGGPFAVDLFTGPFTGWTPAHTAHVGDLDASSRWVTTGWRATASIKVHDDAHAAIVGATVTGTWSGGAVKSCVTGLNGRCSLGKRFRAGRGSVTWTVTDVALSGAVYVPTTNHDPDGDSTGTSIVVPRPA